jgi:hypothetical protein
MPALPRPFASACAVLLLAALPTVVRANPPVLPGSPTRHFLVSFNAAHGEEVAFSLSSDRMPASGLEGMAIEPRFFGADGSELSEPRPAREQGAVVVPTRGFATVRVAAMLDSASRTATLLVDSGDGPRALPIAVPVGSDGRVAARVELACLRGCGSGPLDATILTIGEDGGTLGAVVVLSINAIRDRGASN